MTLLTRITYYSSCGIINIWFIRVTKPCGFNIRLRYIHFGRSNFENHEERKEGGVGWDGGMETFLMHFACGKDA